MKNARTRTRETEKPSWRNILLLLTSSALPKYNLEKTITIGAGKRGFLPHTGDVKFVQQVIELYEAGVEGGGHLRRAAAARPAGPQLARHVLRPEDGGM